MTIASEETAIPKIVAKVLPSPEVRNPTLTQCIVTTDGSKAVKFYEDALGAKIEALFEDDKGRVMHSVLVTPYDMRIVVEDYYPNMHVIKPLEEDRERGGKAVGGTYVYVTIPKDGGTVDEAVEKMRAAGGTVVRDVEDAFYGHRMGIVIDVYGLAWSFGQELEGFTPPWEK